MMGDSICDRCGREFGTATWDEDSVKTYKEVLKRTGYKVLCETCTYQLKEKNWNLNDLLVSWKDEGGMEMVKCPTHILKEFIRKITERWDEQANFLIKGDFRNGFEAAIKFFLKRVEMHAGGKLWKK